MHLRKIGGALRSFTTNPLAMKKLFWSAFSIMFVIVLLDACQEGSGVKKSESHDEAALAETFSNRGAEIVSGTFQTLSANLKEAIGRGGVPEAISYCNLNASPLVDSLSQLHKVVIKRTSHKLRNPRNLATDAEANVIDLYQKNMKQKIVPQAQVEVSDQAVHYYAPIILMEACLKCHGKQGTDISDSDYQVIASQYPQDQAVGFKVGELRGIWSLSFDREDD